MRSTSQRHHVQSLLMRESLLDKQVMASTETPVVRHAAGGCHVIKVGGRSIMDAGRAVVYPWSTRLTAALETTS